MSEEATESHSQALCVAFELLRSAIIQLLLLAPPLGPVLQRPRRGCIATHEVLAQIAARHLAGRRGSVATIGSPSSNRRGRGGGVRRGRRGNDRQGLGRGKLGLQRCRVNAVGMQALGHRLGAVHELRHTVIRHNDVGGRDGLLLVQTPDMQLVDRLDTGNLGGARQSIRAMRSSRVVAERPKRRQGRDVSTSFQTAATHG